MKVPVEWLGELLGQKLSASAMAEALEKAGIEIEQIISSKPIDEMIVVAIVKQVAQHPQADRLKLVIVNDGSKDIEVVCGAPNVRTGLKVALALPGCVLPDGRVIDKAVIRSQQSHGMICSGQELGMSDDHTGILELEPELSPGSKLCDIWSSTEILDIKSAANRADLLSVVGLAREIAAQMQIDFEVSSESRWPGNGAPIGVKVEAKELVTRYMGGDLVVDIEAATPKWMTKRLVAAGVRPINVIVDVTNYVMLELGQPLHAFDATKVKLPLVVRLAKKGEKLVTLDRVERNLDAKDLIIADAAGPIALAGVMGGARTEVGVTTKRIILEAAAFDGAVTRKTAKRHNLRTEASARFERRLPVRLASLAINRAAALLIDLAGAKPSGLVNDQLQVWPWVQHIGVRSSRLTQLFGKELSRQTIAKSLQSLGFEAEVFDIDREARKHLGKPYEWGAKFKTHGAEAFDCSYFVDYIYSLIGIMPGHTAMQQYEYGKPIHTGELKAGDVLFRGGPWVKLKAEERKGVSHNVIYVGNAKVVHPKDYTRSKQGEWERLPETERKVTEESVETILGDPQYLGARRYVENLDDYVAVTVPWWRPDVKTEEDVLEEVAKIVGYGGLPATLPAWRPKLFQADRRWPRVWQLKAAMRSLGLFEVMTYAFVSGEQLNRFGLDARKHLKVKNPLSIEQEYLRSTLLPSLVTSVSANVSYSKEFGLFELSRVFASKGRGELPDEPTHLAVLELRSEGAYLAVKTALDLLAREFRLSFDLKPSEVSGLNPYISAKIGLEGKTIGWIGEVHPELLRAYKIPGSVGYMELDWDVATSKAREAEYRPISRFPSVYRDLAIVVKTKVSWAEVKDLIDDLAVARVEFLSDYYGEELPSGHKSLAVRLEMSSPEKTLTDDDADQRVKKIEKQLAIKLDARPRS